LISSRPRAAVYLTGYAIECILKALLIASTPPQHQAGVLQSFRGRTAHDLLWLRDQLAQKRVRLPVAVAREFAYLAGWSVDVRYDPGPGDREDARRFIRSAQVVLAWADGRM
jgi:hypothetical protein